MSEPTPFRPLRRAAQALSPEDCTAVLERASSGVLALLGDGEYPYAVPLNFCLEEDALFFHGALAGHRVDAMGACAKASFCVVDWEQVQPDRYATDFRSVIVFGTLAPVEDPAQRQRALEAFARKYCPDHPEERRLRQIALESPGTLVARLEIHHVSGKVSRSLAAPQP